ncbi:MAG: hypothetical protein WD226_14515 [Planctomycetota bacterium]
MSSSDDRRRALRELLEAREFTSQADLSAALSERGVDVSQPMLSRDLRTLGVAKVGGRYRWLEDERVTPLETLRSLLRGWSTVAAWRLVAVEPGAASAIARALEAEELPGLVGTLAGDDTVLVAFDDASAAGALGARIDTLLED